MTTEKRKITFNDKEDSVLLNSDSKFVLTAANINEIKEVVNNLSDELDKRLRFNQVFKYLKFNVPSTLKDNCNYSFEFELSENENFENSILFSLINDFQKFSIFENNNWNILTSKKFITSNYKNKSLKIDISSVISDDFKPYFGRYRWKNETTLEIQEYQGFSLGVSEYNDKNFDGLFIKNIYIEGKTDLYEKERISYKCYYVNQNNETVEITSQTTFLSLMNICSFENNELIVPILHTIKNEIIKAEFEHNSIIYTAFLNLTLNPIMLESIKINEELDTIYQNDEKHFTITAKYSNGTTKGITNKCDKILTMNNCYLENNKIIGNGCYDEYGSLIISYNDEDFPDEETFTLIKYINYKIKKFKSLNVTFPEIITGKEVENDLKYSVILTYEDDSTEDVTNNVQIKLIDCEELKCENGNIIIEKQLLNKKNITGLIYYYSNDCKNINISTTFSVKLNPRILTSIIPKFYHINSNEEINNVDEKSMITFKVFGSFDDGTIEELNYNLINVEFMNSPGSLDSSVNIITKSISIGKFNFSEILIFNFYYLDGDINFMESSFLYVRAVKPQYMEIQMNKTDGLNNEFFAFPNIEKELSIYVVYSDGLIKNINDSFEISVAAGNKELIKEINENKIIFNNPEYAEEVITLMISYEDPDFYEKLYEFLNITVFSIN